jgi:hypothetical protein
MRPSEEYRKKCSLRAKRKNEIDENERLKAAISYGPIRPIKPCHIGELFYRNPRSRTGLANWLFDRIESVRVDWG